MALSTGHGASMTFATSAYTAAIRQIGGATEERPEVDTSDLSTTGHRTKIPGDLADAGSFDIEILVDPEDDPPWPDITGAAETVTITYPVTVTGQTAANESGSAFITSVSRPTLATDELLVCTATVTWADGPTWTDETA